MNLSFYFCVAFFGVLIAGQIPDSIPRFNPDRNAFNNDNFAPGNKKGGGDNDAYMATLAGNHCGCIIWLFCRMRI